METFLEQGKTDCQVEITDIRFVSHTYDCILICL